MFFTDGDLDMDDSQKADLLSFVRDDGKGFIGIHSATITFRLLAGVRQDDRRLLRRPSLGRVRCAAGRRGCELPRHGAPARNFTLKDEIYQIKDFSRDNVRVLLRLDAGKVDLSQQGCPSQGQDFAVIWARDYGKGRVLYNGLGHRPEVWDRPEIQKMWLEMVQWSMGLIPGRRHAPPRECALNG